MKNDWIKGENWKVGDIIICIDDISPAITIGAKYKIISSGIIGIMITDDYGRDLQVFFTDGEMECFDLLSNIRQNRLDLILDEDNIS